MRIRYKVWILDCATGKQTEHYRRNLSFRGAQRVAERHARRGYLRNGGEIVMQNWGFRGGDFPRAYRQAVIQLEG